MKPLNIDKTGCSNMSSNCVVWQGPDIECINLCKGDSITEVVYKLAVELCSLMQTFDLKNYDLKCFSSGVCQPKDFKDFLNILINKVCTLQSCTNCGDSCNPCPNPTAPTVGTGTIDPNPEVPIAPAFYYTNQYGDTVTTMPLQGYVNAIGNKVSTNISEIAIAQATLANHEARISSLENAPAPTLALPDIIQNGATVPLDSAVQTLNNDFYTLQTATGNPSDIYTNIQKFPITGANNQLNNPSAVMAALSGWLASPTNEAQVLGNLILTVQDMRLALTNLIANYIPSACSAVNITLSASYDSVLNNVTLFFNGTIPAGFSSTNPLGSNFVISDAFGNSISRIVDIGSYLNNISGYVIPLSGTSINTTGNINVTGYPAYTYNATQSQCNSLLQYTIVNQVVCPAVTLTPGTDGVTYAFNTAANTITYTVEIWDSGGTLLPLQSQTFTTSSVQSITNVFSGLAAGTPYRVRVNMSMNGVVTNCPFIPVTTL